MNNKEKRQTKADSWTKIQWFKGLHQKPVMLLLLLSSFVMFLILNFEILCINIV